MSGIASAASTIPGRVATFWSCWSEWSPSIAASSSSSAKTRAGTRMSGRASLGISHSVSSMRRSSDIEHDPGTPAAVEGLELEPVVRDRLDEWGRGAAAALDHSPRLGWMQLDLGQPAGHERLRLGQEDQLMQPVREQDGSVPALDA